jgi:cytochrome c553
MSRLRSGRPRRAIATLSLAGPALLLLAADEAVESTQASPADEAARELEQALQLEPNIANGLRIYRICAECHQPEGWGLPDGSYPQLAGQHRTVVIKQLADIRSGLRSNPEMIHFASMERIGAAQAVADVAGYIDTLEISVDTGKGPGDDLERGKAMYGEKCARCHGPDGEGDGERYIPRIQSQHYAYLLRQFQKIRDGERGNADPVSRSEPPEWFQAPPGWRNPDFPK